MSSPSDVWSYFVTRSISPPQDDCRNYSGVYNGTWGFVKSITSRQAMVMMVLFGIFCAVLVKTMVFLRNKTSKDQTNVDRTFDAGGQLSLGITAATIVSDWTSSTTYVQSANIATKFGLSGVYWYAVGSSIPIFLFALCCMEMKLRAPGAKTFLQFMRTRFGKAAHLSFCVFGLVNNLMITGMLMLGGGAVLNSLVEDMTVEFASTMLLLSIGCYCFIGGVRGTSYVSYFTTMGMMVGVVAFLLVVFHNPSQPLEKLGSIDRVYRILRCTKNADSYLTFFSKDAFMFGVVNTVGALGTLFLDQSFWQRGVAAKPKEATWGFISAGFVWFAIPFTFATTIGLAYISLSTLQGKQLLTPDEVEKGLVPAVVSNLLWGSTGEILLIVIMIMAVSSAGAAEIMAIVAILVYDIYAVYLKPYRHSIDPTKCLLCDKERVSEGNAVTVINERCSCESMTSCVACGEDDRERMSTKQALKPQYKCRMHGKYRAYNDYLQRLKDWAIVIVTILLLPFTITLNLMDVSHGWLFQFAGILISSGVCPLCLSLVWRRQTGKGVVAALWSGSVCGLIAFLGRGSIEPGGLSPQTFMDNTGKLEVMLIGNCVSILTGLLVCVVVSLLTQPHVDPQHVWIATHDIDNPLSPWTENYVEELNMASGDHRLDNRPSFEKLWESFRLTRISILIASVSFSSILWFLAPLALLAIPTFYASQFRGWMLVVHIWAIGCAVFIIVLPLVEELRDLIKTFVCRNWDRPHSSDSFVHPHEVMQDFSA